MTGLFITFEGGEGVGKTTQTKIIAEKLRQKGYTVITTREPGGTTLGEKIREILLKGDIDKMSPMTEALLFTAVRRDHFEHVIKPNVDAGNIVLCDRYMDTTNAYQGFAHGLSIEKMESLYNLAIGDFKPNLTIIFDIDPSKSHGNLTEINRFEKMGNDWLTASLNGFREVAKQNPDRCILMPSEGSIEEVSERILKILNEKLGL
ncbi:MAG: dTMP kinase [Alphaproteobacteria bacterium]|nr:dTMP kinase [Alphaproteobacteria bacterium]